MLRVLEHHAHAEAYLPDFLWLRPDVLPVQQHRPGGGPQKPIELLDQRGLAGTGMPDHADELPLLDGEVHMVHRRLLKRRARAICVCQVFRLNNRHSAFSKPPSDSAVRIPADLLFVLAGRIICLPAPSKSAPARPHNPLRSTRTPAMGSRSRAGGKSVPWPAGRPVCAA